MFWRESESFVVILLLNSLLLFEIINQGLDDCLVLIDERDLVIEVWLNLLEFLELLSIDWDSKVLIHLDYGVLLVENKVNIIISLNGVHRDNLIFLSY